MTHEYFVGLFPECLFNKHPVPHGFQKKQAYGTC